MIQDSDRVTWHVQLNDHAVAGHFPATTSIITPATPGALLSALLLLALQPALVIGLLPGFLSAFGPSLGSPGIGRENIQVFDTLYLVGRRFGRHSILSCLSNCFEETLVAAVSIVALLAAVVRLDYYSV
jgi:hypothetical protein